MKRDLIHKEDILCFDAHLGIEYAEFFTYTFLGTLISITNIHLPFRSENSNFELFQISVLHFAFLRSRFLHIQVHL